MGSEGLISPRATDFARRANPRVNPRWNMELKLVGPKKGL